MLSKVLMHKHIYGLKELWIHLKCFREWLPFYFFYFLVGLCLCVYECAIAHSFISSTHQINANHEQIRLFIRSMYLICENVNLYWTVFLSLFSRVSSCCLIAWWSMSVAAKKSSNLTIYKRLTALYLFPFFLFDLCFGWRLMFRPFDRS